MKDFKCFVLRNFVTKCRESRVVHGLVGVTFGGSDGGSDGVTFFLKNSGSRLEILFLQLHKSGQTFLKNHKTERVGSRQDFGRSGSKEVTSGGNSVRKFTVEVEVANGTQLSQLEHGLITVPRLLSSGVVVRQISEVRVDFFD